MEKFTRIKQIRDQVEYVKYQNNGRFTLGECVIQRVERNKYLRSRLTLTIKQHEVVRKLSHHFHRDSKFASKTLGIKTIKELLTSLGQSEHIFRTEYRTKTNIILREESRERNANSRGEMRARETKLCSKWTNSLKYLERGKQVEISRHQKCSGITTHKDYNDHCYVHRTIVMLCGCLLFIMTRAESHGGRTRIRKVSRERRECVSTTTIEKRRLCWYWGKRICITLHNKGSG